jgi:alkylation response protein AidB-like acyl-CoA dehydrogenase
MDTRVQAAITKSASERAKNLQPLLDEHGAEMDRRREVTPEVVDGLVAQDMLRLLLPRSLGGQELHLLEHARTMEALGWADASVAWFINQSNVSSATSAAAMPHEAALAVFGNPKVGLAWGARHNKSKAIRVEGGFRLSGTWSFASGGRHTTWLGAHSATQNPDGTPFMQTGSGRADDRSFVFLRSDAKIIDDWQVLGLRGTGSDSYTVEDLFVPDERAPARDSLEERREKGPLYTIGSTLLYATGFCAVSLGIARRLFEAYVDLARAKHSRASPNAMAVNNAVQREIGLLEAKLSSARAFLHEAALDVYDAAAAGKLDVDKRIRLRLATTHGMQQATDVSIASYRAAGTTAILDSAPFERRFRDAMSASQHLQAMPPHIEMVGRHILGVENKIQHI